MIVLFGKVMRVSDPIQKTDDKTGEVTNVWQVQLLHATNESQNAALDLVNIKLKAAVQADAFRKCLAQDVRFPVGLYAFDGDAGLWIEKGTLPTPVKAAA